MSIRLKQPTMQLATLFFFGGGVNLVMRWNGHVFFISLNKRTNAAYENAMKLMINFFWPNLRILQIYLNNLPQNILDKLYCL